MPVPIHTKLGAYEVTSHIGSGGMGEVYRARDSKLGRDVAIKVLPDQFARDPERLARFQREAKLLASLNHPNIATIHGLEQSGGTHFLVMELVPGDTLLEKVAGGRPVPVEEALTIARQIAEALEAAHNSEKGVIHRDLKPANVKVTPEGRVKVLDFGLAKAFAAEPTQEEAGNSPTLSMAATVQGVIMGTAAYMSPEQARGKHVNKATDIFAFGAVLYELLTGKQAFQGDDVSDILAAVIRAEPDWTALPAEVSPAIRAVLARCLAKDRGQRMRDIGDVQLVLNGAFEAPAQPAGAATPSAAASRPLWKRAIPIAAAVVASALAGGAVWTLTPPAPSSPVTRFALALGEGQQFAITNAQLLDVSPDGTRLVYAAGNQLYLRSMSDLEARPLAGTQQAPSNPVSPVFSPDGQSIAFYSTVDQAIKKIAVSGGAAITLCPADGTALGRMNWDAGGIVFHQFGKGIMRVSANGGQPETLVGVKEGEVMQSPQVLPGGEWLLFTSATGAPGNMTADTWDKAQIVVQSLNSSERKTLVSGGSDGFYVPSGHIVYAVGGVLFAVPFDLSRLAVTGGPVPVVEGVRRSLIITNRSAVAQFSVSSTGSLVFAPGPVSVSTSSPMSIGFFDRKGGGELLKIAPGFYQLPRMSPDGKRIAVGSDDGKEASIWIYDLSGTSSMRRLTFEGQGHNRFPVWSPDSQRVAFQSDREKDLGIFWQRADGAGIAERLTMADEGSFHIPESWAAGADGERLLYNAGKGGETALWALSLKDGKAAPFDAVRSTAAALTGAVFSPDGRWVAYASREGRTSSAVYVQPFPPTGAKYQISRDADDGHHPIWSPDGRELVFTPGAFSRLDAVRVATQPSFTFGEAVPVPRTFQNTGPALERPYDFSRDGQRFLGLVDTAVTQGGATAAPRIQVVLNWFEELKAKAPTATR